MLIAESCMGPKTEQGLTNSLRVALFVVGEGNTRPRISKAIYILI